MLIYYPYPSDIPGKKYFVYTKLGKKIYFGQAGASDFTIHKDNERKLRYIKRHQDNENWSKSGIDTAGFWSRWYIWHLPTKEASYQYIKRRFLSS